MADIQVFQLQATYKNTKNKQNKTLSTRVTVKQGRQQQQ